MARLARYFAKGQPQHIIQRGNNREVIFADEADYVFYLKCLSEAAKLHALHIHAYVLMTNHVHLLASPTEETSIPKTLQSVGRRYVQYFNYTYNRTGTLWEGRYKATLIDSDRYMLICMRYIELNPVRANMAQNPKDYRWSSYAYNALGKEDALISPQRLYRKLGHEAKECQSAYRQLFRVNIPQEELKNIRDCTNKAWVLGSERFKNRVEKLTVRRVKPKPRGRPRKIEE